MFTEAVERLPSCGKVCARESGDVFADREACLQLVSHGIDTRQRRRTLRTMRHVLTVTAQIFGEILIKNCNCLRCAAKGLRYRKKRLIVVGDADNRNSSIADGSMFQHSFCWNTTCRVSDSALAGSTTDENNVVLGG